MDVTIQSQIKSPLVRTMQSIPTNSANFVHGIPDNTPPFSRSSVIVAPHRGNPNILNGEQAFRIPQRGRLNRLVLTYRMIGHRNDAGNVVTTDTDNVFQFGDGIEWIQLRSHNHIIQTIHASALPFEVISTTSSDQALKRTLQGLSGYRGTNDDVGVLLNPPPFSFITPPGTLESDDKTTVVKDFLIPIPLSTTFYLKDNLQTRMLEDLEIVVKTRMSPTQYVEALGVGGTQLPWTDRHELSLSCNFINFHENVEEVIRNENFKPNVPAVLLASDHLLFKARHQSSSPFETDLQENIYSVDLSTDALVSDIFIVPKIRVSNNAFERYMAPIEVAATMELKSGGETIFSGNKIEYDGYEGSHYSTVTRQYQNEGVFPLRWSRCGTHIRLALNNTDEFFDGGVSFQSLINPVLTIKLYSTVSGSYQFADMTGNGDQTNVKVSDKPQLIEFDVVLKRKVMLRIDGNTGKLSKSLES